MRCSCGYLISFRIAHFFAPMSDSQRTIFTFLRAELAAEAASGFARLQRIPQTDIIWLLDYFAGLNELERESLLDAMAESAVMAFLPPGTQRLNASGTVD